MHLFSNNLHYLKTSERRDKGEPKKTHIIQILL